MKGSHALFVPLFVVFFLSAFAQSPAPQPQPTQPSSNQSSASAPTTNNDAAKAAERKKRFDEAKARLENGTQKPQPRSSSDSGQGCNASPDDLSISPILVNMLVGESQGFSLFDLAGHKLTSQADWSLSDSSVAELTVEGGQPRLTSKQTGTVRVVARVDSRSAEAVINVITPEEMKPGTIRWSAPGTPCFKTKAIVPAVPAMH